MLYMILFDEQRLPRTKLPSPILSSSCSWLCWMLYFYQFVFCISPGNYVLNSQNCTCVATEVVFGR